MSQSETQTFFIVNQNTKLIYAKNTCTLNFAGVQGIQIGKEEKPILSLDCRGCSQMHLCQVRYAKVKKGELVQCPSGESHLVDQ
jgi:hypothetical protein